MAKEYSSLRAYPITQKPIDSGEIFQHCTSFDVETGEDFMPIARQ